MGRTGGEMGSSAGATPQPGLDAGSEGLGRAGSRGFRWDGVPEADGGGEEGVLVDLRPGVGYLELVGLSSGGSLGRRQRPTSRRGLNQTTHDLVHHGGPGSGAAELEGIKVELGDEVGGACGGPEVVEYPPG